MFLSVTPLSQRRVLVPLLFLTVAGFIVSLVVTKEGSIIRRGLVIALLVETAAFFLPTLSPGGAAKGVLDQVARATEVAPPWVDRPCIDEATGGQVVFNFAGSDENMVSVPTSRCWTIVTLPPDSEKWHSVPRGQGSWAYYILPIGGDEKVVGPLGWHSPTPVHFLLPEKFLIQSSAENKSVEFWIPADSPEKNPDGDPGN
jgi:hypothetical protein